MKITYLFYSLKDLSHISNGEKLHNILASNGLIIDKAGGHEPIREEFNIGNLPKLWNDMKNDGRCSSNYFLFKGKNDIMFSGMAVWNVNLHPNNKAFNSISLWLSITKKYDFDKLVQLGDDIFEWSEAVYGYITEESKNKANNMPGNIYEGLPGLMWINYFGSNYIMQPDFYMPNGHVPINHGIRINLCEAPDDEILSDSNYLESCKNKIGREWFWHKPRMYNIKVPLFDKSLITRH